MLELTLIKGFLLEIAAEDVTFARSGRVAKSPFLP